MDVSRNSRPGYKHHNRAILFTCDEQTYEQVINALKTVHGLHIYYSKSSKLRLVIEEKGY